MANELLGPVDWNEWRRVADNQSPAVPQPPKSNKPLAKAISLATALIVDGKAHQISEAERVALLVLSLGRSREVDGQKKSKAVAKIIKMALRDIEQAVLTCEQDIDYE